MNSDSLELSKELYELSGWDDTHAFWDGDEVSFNGELTWEGQSKEYFHQGTAYDDWPAYDLGYLLRKLPQTSITRADGNRKHRYYVDSFKLRDEKRQPLTFEAETPEDAAAMLAIELFKQGVVTRGGDEEARTPEPQPMQEIDREAICADCGHPKRQHSGLAGCYLCDPHDADFCDRFVVKVVR